jgi:hypothetical protein
VRPAQATASEAPAIVRSVFSGNRAGERCPYKKKGLPGGITGMIA